MQSTTTVTTTTTTAEQIAAALGNDGQVWETADGRTLVDLCGLAGGRRSFARSEWDDEARANRPVEVSRSDAHDLTRYRFADGSAIVVADGGWDVEGAAPFSWAGA